MKKISTCHWMLPSMRLRWPLLSQTAFRDPVPRSCRLLAPDLKAKTQEYPRVRKISVRNSGAGNGCANFMGAWKNASFLQEKPMSIKFLVLGGGDFGFGGGPILFLWGRADFSERLRGRDPIAPFKIAMFLPPWWPRREGQKQTDWEIGFMSNKSRTRSLRQLPHEIMSPVARKASI